MPTVRFNGRIDGAAGAFARGVSTKDPRGAACGATTPRWGDEALFAGSVDPDSVIELLPDSTYFAKVLATGVDVDGQTPIVVTTERASSSGSITLNIYLGDIVGLIQAGTPTLTNGFGYAELENGSKWWRWEGLQRGLGQGDLTDLGLGSGASLIGLPHNIADDFGLCIPELRVDGDGASGGNTAYDSDGAVLFTPRAASVAWGCVTIQCVAHRYSAGTVAGADAEYVPLGVGLFYWQKERDPSRSGDGWQVLRGEDDFNSDTGGVKHDHQPGRFRVELWGGPKVSTPWRRSDEVPSMHALAAVDYLNAGAVGPDTNAKIGQVYWARFRRDPETDLWTPGELVSKVIDNSAHPTLGASETYHIHSAIVSEFILGDQSSSEHVVVQVGDPQQVNGVIDFIYTPSGDYDPDDPDTDADWEDAGNWASARYILGDGNAYPGSRQMCGQQGPEFGDVVMFSDDNNEMVINFNAMTYGEPPVITTRYQQSQDQYAYTFRCQCDKPATPGTRMFVDRFTAALNASVASGESAAEKTLSFLMSPDCGVTWTPIWKTALSNATAGPCGDYLIVGSINGGMYAVPIPTVVRAAPILLAPGGKNCAVDNHFITKFGAAAAVSALSRNGDGVFEDASFPLPPDPSLMSKASKFTKTGAGGNLVVHPGDTVSVISTGGGFTDGARMRTFVWDILANPDEHPTNPFCVTNLRSRVLNNGGGGASIYASRGGGQTKIVVTDGSRWFRDGQVVPHNYGSGSKANVAIRALLEDSGGVPQSQRFRAILEGAYEGPGHVPYPVAPNTDASGNPETVPLGWAVGEGSTIFGTFAIGQTVSGSLEWFADTTLAAIEVPISILEVGDPTGDDWFVMEFMLGVHSGGLPTTRALRFRGEADGAAFDEEIDIGDQDLTASGDPREYLMFYPGTIVNFAVRITAAGLVPIMDIDNYRVTDGSAVANTAGFGAAMVLGQVGADFADADAKPAELAWFGVRADPASMSSEAAEHEMGRMGYLVPRVGAERSRSRSRARSGSWIDRYA